MPAVRLSQFLALTAFVALLSAGGALAEPRVGMSMDAMPAAAPAAPDRAAAKPDELATQPAAAAEATSPAPASPAAEVPANKPQAASGGDEVPATAIVNTAPIVVSTELTPQQRLRRHRPPKLRRTSRRPDQGATKYRQPAPSMLRQ